MEHFRARAAAMALEFALCGWPHAVLLRGQESR